MFGLRRKTCPRPEVLPPINQYREFVVKNPDGTDLALSGSSDVFSRNRRDDARAPQSLYRCVSIAVRNLSAQTITVQSVGAEPLIVPPSTTDILNPGRTFIDGYSITADGAVTAGELYVVERCRAWQGWNEGAQDL